MTGEKSVQLSIEDKFTVEVMGMPVTAFDPPDGAEEEGFGAPGGAPGGPAKKKAKPASATKPAATKPPPPLATKTEEKPAEADKKKEGGGSEGGGGIAKEVTTVLDWITSHSGDVVLKAQKASVLPKGKSADDFRWNGPVKTFADYPEETSFPLGVTEVYARTEIRFYYSGQYISDFNAELVDATLDGLTRSLEGELIVDHTGADPSGVAFIDWRLTYHRSAFTMKTTVTITGRARGDGKYTTSQPSIEEILNQHAKVD